MLAPVATLDDVISAYRAIAAAEQHYREILRAARAAGVEQKDIAEALGRSAEKLRLDALSDAERDELRRKARDREAGIRARAKAA